MKLYEFFISENRRDDLHNKYKDKFWDKHLDDVLNDEFVKKTNYKYADFILKSILQRVKIPGTSEVFGFEQIIPIVKDFDKFQKKLDKKDINQYDIKELHDVIFDYKLDKKEKKSVPRIFEDQYYYVIKPETREDSCKYGSNTRWCTAAKHDNRFNDYTVGLERLYYIISKEEPSVNPYFKIAIHITNINEYRLYDSHDTKFSDGEKKLFLKTHVKLMKSIFDDYEKSTAMGVDEFTRRLRTNEYQEINFRLTLSQRPNVSFFVSISSFDIADFMDDDSDQIVHANADLTISRKVSRKKVILDKYLLFCIFDLTYKVYNVSFGDFDLDDDTPIVDFNLLDKTITGKFDTNYPLQNISTHILQDTMRLIYKDYKNIDFGGLGLNPKVKRVENISPLRQSMIDYLSSGNVGTKLNFLLYAKKIFKTDNPDVYVNKNGEPINVNGYLTKTFGEMKREKLIDYYKVGRKYYLIRGENFPK